MSAAAMAVDSGAGSASSASGLAFREAKRARTTETLPWIEKYRPKSLSDLVAQDDITSTLDKLMSAGRLPHLLFYGPPGTGKTSTILACARKLFGEQTASMVLELNASDNRGIGDVRDLIKNFAATRKLFSNGVKLIILDEADNMTRDAQFALRRVIEKYTKNARFCLICNYVSKIIPALQSRCTRFRFSPLQTSQVAARVDGIIASEAVNITECGRQAVLRLGDGDMRKILNVLQSTHMAFDVVDAKNVYACTGKPSPEDVKAVLALLLNESFKGGFDGVRAMQVEKGLALNDLLAELHKYAMHIKLPAPVRIFLLTEMADLEYRLAFDTNERLQLGSLVGIFHVARGMLAEGLQSERGALGQVAADAAAADVMEEEDA